MKKNNSWFSIVIWMWIMILITLSAYVILSYMIPFMKSVRWIENTSNAYYQSYAWVEESLYFVNKSRSSLTSETWASLWNSVWYFFNTFSSWTKIPEDWFWNSEFSKNYNQISYIEPIQLQIWRKNHSIANLWNQNINFIFKVPDLDKDWSWNESFSWDTTYPVINWILSSENDSLIASWTYINWDQINNSNDETTIWNIKDQEWENLFWSWFTFWDYYQNNCNWVNSGCILKMSILNDLKLIDNRALPYLEYSIDFPWSVPDRYTRIESYGKSYGFQKKLDVRVPQQTVNQAFDFTVFQ